MTTVGKNQYSADHDHNQDVKDDNASMLTVENNQYSGSCVAHKTSDENDEKGHAKDDDDACIV